MIATVLVHLPEPELAAMAGPGVDLPRSAERLASIIEAAIRAQFPGVGVLVRPVRRRLWERNVALTFTEPVDRRLSPSGDPAEEAAAARAIIEALVGAAWAGCFGEWAVVQTTASVM